jgi:N-acetylmuramoyl-L-alanine amidase CwlA
MYNVTVKKNRPIEYLVIHYTAGTSSKGGTAKRVATSFGKQSKKASADFIVDQDDVVQFNPDIRNQYCWAVGDKIYNKFSTSLGGTLYKTASNANCI